MSKGLGFVSTGGGGGVPADAGGGGSSLDLSSIFAFLSAGSSSEPGATPAGVVDAARRTFSQWHQRIADLRASEDASGAAADAEAAARSAGPSSAWLEWLRSHQTEVLIGAAAVVAVMVLRRRSR